MLLRFLLLIAMNMNKCSAFCTLFRIELRSLSHIQSRFSHLCCKYTDFKLIFLHPDIKNAYLS
jgi:hypothetical protein